MPSIDEFLELLDEDADKAFKTYFFNIDGPSLDGTAEVRKECRRQKVCFEFVEPNKILMSALDGKSAEYENEIWYLPWVMDGASKAFLDDKGPAIFSTSQLDGCRFTIQYHDAERKAVTVLHLAGTVGHTATGSKLRDAMEVEEGLRTDLPAKRTRRYSISKGKKSSFERVGEDFSLQYDGNKASIFGFRTASGAWRFYAQQMMKLDGEADRTPYSSRAKVLRRLTPV